MTDISALTVKVEDCENIKNVVDNKIIYELLAELEIMIQEMDPDAEEKANELRDQLGDTVDRQLMITLSNQVSRFEFEAALESVVRLKEEIPS